MYPLTGYSRELEMPKGGEISDGPDAIRKAVRDLAADGQSREEGLRGGAQAEKLDYLVRYSMTPKQAIRSASSVAAALLDHSDDMGAVAPGHWADLIANDGDPPANIKELQRVSWVMKGGEVYKGEK